MKSTQLALFSLALAALPLGACGADNGDCPIGSQGCACTSGGACNSGLSCTTEGFCAGAPGGGTVKRVFVTSAQYEANFGGLAQADTLCNASAAALGGKWVAWLSDENTNAVDRVKDVSPWYLVDGSTVAFANASQLRATPSTTIRLDERAGTSSSIVNVWTGTGAGGMRSHKSCGSWTSTDYNTTGTYGTPNSDVTGWTGFGDNSCQSRGSLYCFEQ
jgi:hypothetical protein